MFAPFYYDAYTDTEIFLTWIEQVLCPELTKNQVVVMDNASFHRSPKIRELIESRGAELKYLPTYSPDLNPIEHQWRHLKLKIEKIRKFCENIDGIMKMAFCMSN